LPAGGPPPPRWRPVAWLAAVLIVVITVPRAVALWPWRGPALLDPEGVDQAVGDPGILGFALYLLLLGCGLACLPAVLVRFRRARGIERQQLKWLLFACAVPIAIVIV